jgi:hypothetical protein
MSSPDMRADREELHGHTVRRAVEIVAWQLQSDVGEALDALEAVAAAADETLENVAIHVLEGTVRFDS